MERKIIRDTFFLAKKAEKATALDLPIADDLLDTLAANADRCVGLAANMIGQNKAIIAVAAGPIRFAMLNPVITKKRNMYLTQEGCLSLDGERPCTRFQEIEVQYQDRNLKTQTGTYSGFVAQIIQHEVDHCQGILI